MGILLIKELFRCSTGVIHVIALRERLNSVRSSVCLRKSKTEKSDGPNAQKQGDLCLGNT